MRAGPLSNPEVVSLLNRRFVPVYVSNEDYEAGGAAPAAEKAERDRIWRQALAAGQPSGTVHVYIVGKDGRPIDSLHVAEAAESVRLIPFLEGLATRLKLPAGDPLVKPAPQAPRPAAPPGALVLHIVARGLAGASWDGIPAEDWIVLDREAQDGLLPPTDARAGTAWELPATPARRLLVRFYPQTENNDLATNRIHEARLAATVITIEKTRLRARVEGKLKMDHSFYPGRPDGKAVEADILGYLDIDPATRGVTNLVLVAEQARYGTGRMNVALHAVPER
jgi:hypothetical protein